MKGTTYKRYRDLGRDDKNFLITMLLFKCFGEDDKAINEYLDGVLSKVDI